jgi:hypothetical protein
MGGNRAWTSAARRFALGGVTVLLSMLAVRADAVRSLGPPIPPPPGYTPHRGTVDTSFVNLDASQLQPSGDSLLTVVLPNGTTVTLHRSSIETVDSTRYVWIGRVAGDPMSRVTITLVRNSAVGTISTGTGRSYRLRTLGTGAAVIEEVDASLFPDEADPDSASTGGTPGGGACDGDDPSPIDVLVVYTPGAQSWIGTSDLVEGAILQAVSETNQSYQASDVTQRLNLVHIEPVSYTEDGDITIDRNRLQDPTDGIMDSVHDLRNQYGADIVVLLTFDTSLCGLTWVMTNVSTAWEKWAFAVVSIDCATDPVFSFGHELGHVMGARHDWPSDPTSGSPYLFNHGHLQPTPTPSSVHPWRSIMAKDGSCANCDRLPMWSNPAISYPSGLPGADPTGVLGGSQPEDDHLVLNLTASTVANFRCSVAQRRPDPWMRDTWVDTGAEPDPAQAALAMWKSPSIWVRNAPDPTHAHAFEHENPIANQTNDAYVKIRNGATAGATGTLEIYTSPASTGLSWPTDWTPAVGSQTVTFSAPYESRIVEFAWTPTQEGHVCMLARWLSASDPMTHPEGPDIEVNVRNNNNLVWRNLNILDGSLETQTATFFVANPTQKEAVYSLSVRPNGRRGRPGFGAGELAFEVDAKLLASWRESGAYSHGFRWEGRRFVLKDPRGGAIEGFRLPARTSRSVRMTVHRAKTPAAGYTPAAGFDIVQTRGQVAWGKVVGGVSYEFAPAAALR